MRWKKSSGRLCGEINLVGQRNPSFFSAVSSGLPDSQISPEQSERLSGIEVIS